MADESLGFLLRRWLLWGLIAMAILAAIVIVISVSASSDDPLAEGEPIAEGGEQVAEQIEWSVVLVDQSGQTVTLKADLPLGAVTETWVNNEMFERGAGDRWDWDVAAALPNPVVEITGTDDCAELNELLDEWLQGVEAALGDVYNWQSRAFAQATVDQMRVVGCAIDDTALTGL